MKDRITNDNGRFVDDVSDGWKEKLLKKMLNTHTSVSTGTDSKGNMLTPRQIRRRNGVIVKLNSVLEKLGINIFGEADQE